MSHPVFGGCTPHVALPSKLRNISQCVHCATSPNAFGYCAGAPPHTCVVCPGWVQNYKFKHIILSLFSTKNTDEFNQMSLNIEELVAELTLAEKISLLAGSNFWQTVPIDRLNIPAVTVSDGPNGIRGTRFFDAVPSNCFPCGTGLASTFNKDLLVEAGELMCKEAKMKGAHCILGPTCNIARGPLGGRAFESYSEDPVLSGHIAASVVNGIQLGNVVACLKHFVCNDQEKDRKSVDTLVSERALREVYLKPFQIAVRDANPKLIMTAYNKINGEHVSQSKKLLEDVLRKEWGWNGMTMSDWYGVYLMKESLDAGLNLEMPGPTRFRQETQTLHAVAAKAIHSDVIDDNVRRVLQFVSDCMASGIPKDQVESENTDPAAGQLLRKVGGESLVLLKNDGLLPLSPTKAAGNERIAVIGPNARAAQNSGGGSASLTARYTVTPFDGIVEKVKERAGENGVVIDYAMGAYLNKTLPDIGTLLTQEDGSKGVQVSFFTSAPGSPDRKPFDVILSSTSRLFFMDYKHESLTPGDQLFYADLEGYYTPLETATYEFGCSCLGTAQMFLDGKLVVDNKTNQTKGDAFFLAMGTREEKATVHLERGRKYKLKVEFGTGPTSALLTEYQERGGVYFGADIKTTHEEALQGAVALAKQVDKVVLVTGLSKDWESEGFDRPHMDVPGYTDRLISEVARANPNVVVVNQSGSPVTMPWVDDVRALVQAWYGGNELGNVIADVLFGDVNPSGKLSLTFPEKVEHNPSFLNYGSVNGRVLYGEDVFVGYKYYEKVQRQPLFPFGFGLSYTSFEFKNTKCSLDGKNVKVSVEVTNTGKADGAEVVQVYIAPQNPRIIRPTKELKDFAKVFLKAGQTKTAEVVIPVREATSYWDSYKNKWLSEKSTYKVLVGNSSDKVLGEGEFETQKDDYWLGLE